MNRKILLAAKSLLISSAIFAQGEAETSKGELHISGSVDAYYRYNFANAKNENAFNNNTSFTNSQNSIELGMASLKASYSKGKAEVIVDLGLGTRASEFSYAEDGILQAVKQAYLVYKPTDNIRIAAGKWGTHLGYEVLDPQLNRNYSMSYMFSYGPFSHTGLKADVNLGQGFGVMAGVTNPTDLLSASFARKNIIAQVSKTSDRVNAFLNYAGGKDLEGNDHNQIGLTATGKISNSFSLGYDGTVKFLETVNGDAGKWWGGALYLNADPSDKFGITLRAEYFDDKKNSILFGTSLIQSTLSFNIKPADGLVIIPEFRIDSAKDPIFIKNDGSNTKSTSGFLLAALYSF